MAAYESLGTLHASLIQAECAGREGRFHVPLDEVVRLYTRARKLRRQRNDEEWDAETRLVSTYACKVVCGRRIAKAVEMGKNMPPGSVSQLCRYLESFTTHEAALDFLFTDLPSHLKKKVAVTRTYTLASLLDRVVAVLASQLPPRYVPFPKQVKQALVNWWVSKLSL